MTHPHLSPVDDPVPPELETARRQLGPLLQQMETSAHDLRRIGQALNAVASLTTSGNPIQTNLGVLRSEDLGALLSLMGDCLSSKTESLEQSLRTAANLNRPTS